MPESSGQTVSSSAGVDASVVSALISSFDPGGVRVGERQACCRGVDKTLQRCAQSCPECSGMASYVRNREALASSKGNFQLGRVDCGDQLDLAVVGDARAVVFV
jgi:hypothetical protein